MMFINTTKNETVESLINGFKKRIDNDFYLYQQNYIFGNYYNIDDDLSTSTETTGLINSAIGSSSPLIYNLYIDMPICGISDMDVNIDIGDFGVESDEISGDIYLFPDIIIPSPEDRFTLKHIPHLLFKVLSVTTVKLDNGKNMWRLSFKLDRNDIDNTNIKELVNKKYHVLIENIGSDMKVAIEEDKIKIVKSMDSILSRIKSLYVSQFYSQQVDTLILNHNDKLIYDPYLIEFIIQNDLLSDSNIEIIFYHQLYKSNSFIVDFNDTIFSHIMKNEISKFKINNMNLRLIRDKLSIFLTRNEIYYEVTHEVCKSDSFFSGISYFDSNTEIDLKNIKPSDSIINIIVNIMNGRELSDTQIYGLENIRIIQDKYNFYIIPLLIYSLIHYTKKIMK